MKKIKVMSVFGTRPEAIKMAPLVKELERRDEIDSLVCITAQHREMLDSVMTCFNISPDFDLDIMTAGQSLGDILSAVLKGMEHVFDFVRPDLVLVHGDTQTALSAAIAAFYADIPVGHVEAGLRSFDRRRPFPEEMNRTLISRLATLHFAPTELSAQNLRSEGVRGVISVTGNTVIDAVKLSAGREKFDMSELNGLDFSKKIITLTCHRKENCGEPMERIFAAVREIAGRHGDVQFVYPVHLSPEVQHTAHRCLDGIENVLLTAPIDAFDMHLLLSRSYMVMTDSGGLQEEAPALGKPVLVLREETERPEAVKAGTVKLVGTQKENIIREAEWLLTDDTAYRRMASARNPYGDGRASERIADKIIETFTF